MIETSTSLFHKPEVVSVAETLAHLRRESLDLYSRIHSITEDTLFVNRVHQALPQLPLIPNLRCGAWYVDPAIAAQEPAYFKSTDGHYNNWSFNLRRPNLHLLSIVSNYGGLVLVDSTRSGKRLPDALAKTVPIWCAVINRAIYLSGTAPEGRDWNTKLYCPPGAVSVQEKFQIEERLDQWAINLQTSSYCLPRLEKPLRPLWVTPSSSSFPRIPSDGSLGFFPIICVSASMQIQEGLGRRSNGFTYIQGSGDDHELWGMGLTPQLFWKYHDTLLQASRSEILEVVSSIVTASQLNISHAEWTVLPTPVEKIKGLLVLGSVSELPSTLPVPLPWVTTRPVAYVVVTASTSQITTSASGKANVLQMELPEGKKGQIRFLQMILPCATAYIKSMLQTGAQICICCDSGKDVGVGVALAALQMFFDEAGEFVHNQEQQYILRSSASKQSIQTRLQWIITSRPQANPSRATLKRVNEFLLTSPSFRRPQSQM